MPTSSRLKTKQMTAEEARCRILDTKYSFCHPSIQPHSLDNIGSPAYKAFIKNVLAKAVPYSGKRVYIVHKSNNFSMVCPEYKIKLNKRWYSFSIAKNGYIYLHMLRDFLPASKDCAFVGHHITLGPHRNSNSKLHFHITRLEIDATHSTARRLHQSICSVSYKDLQDNLQNLGNVHCFQNMLTIKDAVAEGVVPELMESAMAALAELITIGLTVPLYPKDNTM